MNDNELKKIFRQQKHEIPDDGFSERVLRQLPRDSAMPLWEKGVWVLLSGCVLFMAIRVVLSAGLASLLAHTQQVALFFTKALSILFSHPITFLGLFFVLFLSLTGYLVRERSW